MSTELNGSSYYRANPFYMQGYLPDSALRNRRNPTFQVELPQGDQYFEPSNKKHFQRIGYYSTIGEEQIIHGDHISSPARERQYFRNLNIADIEGATPNTLISKAVKNRIKAQAELQRRELEQKQAEEHERRKYHDLAEDDRKRREALAKMKKNNNEPNYHEKIMKLKTQQAQSQKQQLQRQENNQIYANRSQVRPRKNQQMASKLRQIEQLEKQLQRLRSLDSFKQTNHLNYQQQNHIYPENSNNNYKVQTNEANLANYRSKNSKSNIQQIHQNQYNPNNYNNYGEQYMTQNRQQKQRNTYQSKPSTVQQAQRKRSNTLEYRPPPNDYPQKNTVQSKPNNQRNEAYLISPKQTRQMHRRINPTFLSYGSQSIGLAGKNIVGF